MLNTPRDVRLRQLHAPALAGELHRGDRVHRHAGGADRMALRLQSARRIDRQPAILRGPAFQHRARALARRGQTHRLVFQQFGDGEAVVRFNERQFVQLHVRRVQCPLPRLRRALEPRDVALADRQEVVDLHCGTEAHRLAHRARGFLVRHHQRRRAIRDQRAVRALQRRRDVRILLADMAAEIEAEVTCASAHRGCPRRSCGSSPRSPPERIGLVAVALEIASRRCGRTHRRIRRGCRLPPSGSWPSAGCRRFPAPGVAVIFSTPMTSAKRPRPAARKSRAPCTAAEPEAHAFS